MNAFVEILREPKSYRETAQYFDGISRQAIKAWVLRKDVPEKHWPNLRRLCEEYGKEYTEDDFRNWARASGKRLSIKVAKKALTNDWAGLERRLRKYASCFSKDDDLIRDAVQDSLVSMMEYGKTATGYGCRCVRNWFYYRNRHYHEYTREDDYWADYQLNAIAFPSQERILYARQIVEIAETLPSRYRDVVFMMAKGCGKYEMADYLGVEPQSVGTYKAHARKLLNHALAEAAADAEESLPKP